MASTYQELPIAALSPSPDNVRRDLGDVTDLAASIEAAGIVEPLVVTADGDGYLVVAGHRRLEGARKAGLETVPCIVRDDLDERDRVEIMLIENLQRQDLNALEEAHAFERLVKLGNKQRQLAERIGCSQSHISKRLALLRLPDVARDALDAGGITIEQAVKLAPLPAKDVASLFKTKKSVPGWEIDNAVRKHEMRQAYERAVADLAKSKVTVVNDAPGPAWKHRLGEPESYSLEVTEDQHRGEPCHVATIRNDGHVDYWCSQPERHAPSGESSVKVPKKQPQKAAASQTLGASRQAAKKETPEQRAERELDEQRRKDFAVAEEDRKKFVAQLVQQQTLPTGWPTYAASIVVALQAEPFSAEAAVLLGETPPDGGGGFFWEWGTARLAEIAGRDVKSANRVLYALGLAAAESAVRDVTWSIEPIPEGHDDRDVVVAHFDHLVEQGYELTAVERWLLGREEPAVEAPVESSHTQWSISPVGKSRPPKKWKLSCACGFEALQTSKELCEQRQLDHLRDAAAEREAVSA